MIRNEFFFVKTIKESKYILPTGQTVADLMRGIKINDTGELIWNLLQNEISEEKLIEAVINEFGNAIDNQKEIENDIVIFETELRRLGMILDDVLNPCEENLIHKVKIAGTTIAFYGDEGCFPKGFESFYADDSIDEDLRIDITNKKFITRNGNVLVRNSALNVMEIKDGYILRFPETDEIIECNMRKDGTYARFVTYPSMTDQGKEILFHAIRAVFLYNVLPKGFVAIHSASILYKDKAWLFSASAGTGKSTHANYWNKLYGTPFVNGDLNLVKASKEGVFVYGMPWCGTSEIFDVKTYELGGIIFLKRGLEDRVETLSEEEKILLTQQRIISPSWKKEMTEKIFEAVEAFSDNMVAARLVCTKNEKSAAVMKEYLDKI